MQAMRHTVDSPEQTMIATINVFDRVLKVLARNFPQQFLELALPEIHLQVVGTLENVELALPEERVDFVHRVLDGEQEKALHLEFQTEHKTTMPERVFVYSALLTRQLGMEVISVVIYLQRRTSPLPTAYEVKVAGETVNRFDYQVVPLWEYADEIAAGRWPELAPLLIVLRKAEPDDTALSEERALIMREPDRKKRADLLACAVTIAARYFDKDFLWRFFREEVEMIREATFIDEWLEEKLEEGLQQGLEQGLDQGAQRQLLRVLGHRFGHVPSDLEARLRTFDVARLETLLDFALDAKSLDEFRRHIPAA